MLRGPQDLGLGISLFQAPSCRLKSIRELEIAPTGWLKQIGSVLVVTQAGAGAPSCTTADGAAGLPDIPADSTAGLSDAGSAYAYTANASHSDAACLGYLRDQAVRNIEIRQWHGLCRACQG